MGLSIEIVNVRLPREIVAWLDQIVSRGIYKSRAEAIREFSRDYLKGVNGIHG